MPKNGLNAATGEEGRVINLVGGTSLKDAQNAVFLMRSDCQL